MKTKKSIIACAWVLLAIVAWSCNNDSEESSIGIQQENFVADHLMLSTNPAINRVRSNGFGGPSGALFGNFQSRNGRSSASSPSSLFRSHGRIESDTTASDTTITNPTCLMEQYDDDGNGNYTYTLDFGDGCDYYGEFLKGKLVEKGTYNESSFSSRVTYTNFGGNDWTIDGIHSYSGTWGGEYGTTEPGDTSYTDTANYVYNASYEFSADLTTSYLEFSHDSSDYDTSNLSTDGQLIIVDYVAQGSEEVDQEGYTVKSRTESVEVSTGESFQAQVDIPLVFDYACSEDDVWIFASGKESGSYTYGDEMGTYSIDYGDGSCDNIVTITENGISEEIDLGEIWEEWEEACDHEG